MEIGKIKIQEWKIEIWKIKHWKHGNFKMEVLIVTFATVLNPTERCFGFFKLFIKN